MYKCSPAVSWLGRLLLDVTTGLYPVSGASHFFRGGTVGALKMFSLATLQLRLPRLARAGAPIVAFLLLIA